MSLKVFLFLVLCHQLSPPIVDGRMWSIFRPARPIMIVPPPGYYHQPIYGRQGIHPNRINPSSDHLEDQRSKGSKDQKSAGNKDVQFDHDPMFNPGMYQGDIIGPLPDVSSLVS